MSYLPDNREELEGIIETGRDSETALKVFDDFLDDWRNGLIEKIESIIMTGEQLQEFAIELRVIKKFRRICHRKVDMAKMAREELSKDGK